MPEGTEARLRPPTPRPLREPQGTRIKSKFCPLQPMSDPIQPTVHIREK